MGSLFRNLGDWYRRKSAEPDISDEFHRKTVEFYSRKDPVWSTTDIVLPPGEGSELQNNGEFLAQDMQKIDTTTLQRDDIVVISGNHWLAHYMLRVQDGKSFLWHGGKGTALVRDGYVSVLDEDFQPQFGEGILQVGGGVSMPFFVSGRDEDGVIRTSVDSQHRRWDDVIAQLTVYRRKH